MPKLSLHGTSNASHLAGLMLSMAADRETVERHGQAHATSVAGAADWSDTNAKSLMDRAKFEYEFGVYYVHLYRSLWPDQPIDQYEARSSREMAKRLTGYLLFRVQHTRGNHESGLVGLKTLRAWAFDAVYVTGHHVLGPASVGSSRRKESVIGTRSTAEDSLWRLVKIWVNAQGQSVADGGLGLPRKRVKVEFWGKGEAALILAELDQQMVVNPRTAGFCLQTKGLHQTSLGIGSRPGSLLSTGGKAGSDAKRNGEYLKSSEVHLRQPKRHEYVMQLDLSRLKGFNGVHNDPGLIRPLLTPVRRLGNLQFEAQLSLIPVMISRRLIHGYDTQSQSWKPMTDMDEFLACEGRTFRCVGDQPLFVESGLHGEDLGVKPWVTQAMASATSRIATNVGLPGGRVYNYRHNMGAVTKILEGVEGQAISLHHRQGQDAGATNYSAGQEDMPLCRYSLQDFGPNDQHARLKLEASNFVARLTESRAVEAVLRRMQSRGGTYAIDINEQVRKRLSEAERDDAEFVRLKAAQLATSKGTEARRAASKALDARRAGLRNRVRSTVMAETKRERMEEVGRTMEEQLAAEKILGDLMYGLPQLLRPESERLNAVFAEFKPPAKQTAIPVGMRTYADEQYWADGDEEDDDRDWDESDRFFDKANRVIQARADAIETGQFQAQGSKDGAKRLHRLGTRDGDVDDLDKERAKFNKVDLQPVAPSEDDLNATALWPHDETVSTDEAKAVIQARIDLLRVNWELLAGRVDMLGAVDSFIAERHICPFCDISQVGAHKWQAGTGNRWSTRRTGVLNPEDVSSHGKRFGSLRHHIAIMHSDEFEAVKSGDKVPFPADINRTDHSEQDETDMARQYDLAFAASDVNLDASPDELAELYDGLFAEDVDMDGVLNGWWADIGMYQDIEQSGG